MSLNVVSTDKKFQEIKVLRPNQFFCQFDNCIYKEGSRRFFDNKFSLKQHILKMHTKKDFYCGKCDKAFPNDKQKQYHESNCGIDWKCCCGKSYAIRESLLTHARRANHQLTPSMRPPKRSFKSTAASPSAVQIIVYPAPQIFIQSVASIQPPPTVLTKQSVEEQPVEKRLRKILPKAPESDSSTPDNNTATETFKFDCTTQTELKDKCNRCNIKPSVKNGTSVASTQTSRRTILRKLHRNHTSESRASQCTPSRRHQKHRTESIETQTEHIIAKMKRALNSSTSTSDLKVDVSAQSVMSCLDMLLGHRWKSNRCSSETQTSPRAKINCASSSGGDEIVGQTEFSMLRLLAGVCHRLQNDKGEDWTPPPNIAETTLHIPETIPMETQTCSDISEACAHLLTNMETQTCTEDELLFPELEISDTQTQTPWPDLMDYCYNLDQSQLLSAEIQTDITGQDCCFGDAIVTDTETQTHDLLPMQELTSSYTQTFEDIFCDYFGFQEK